MSNVNSMAEFENLSFLASDVVSNQSLNERATITKLVHPLLETLGWDVNNPYEVYPEYPVKFGSGIKKVDLALKLFNQIPMIIECKRYADNNLDKATNQLRQYYNNPKISPTIGVVTNGREYMFFGPSPVKKSIMAETPFLQFNMEAIRDDDINLLLGRLSRYTYKDVEVRNFLRELYYNQELNKVIPITKRKVTIDITKSKSMGHDVYIGSAPLYQLAQISRPDCYDNLKDLGVQRPVVKERAKRVNEYLATATPGFCPPIILNARRSPSESWEISGDSHLKLTVNIGDFKMGEVQISRLDGGHRLAFAEGHGSHYKITDKVLFILHVGLSINEEIDCFTTLNAHQKPVQSSLLDHHRSTKLKDLVTPPDDIEDFKTWCVTKLDTSQDSAIYNLISNDGKVSEVKPLSRSTVKSVITYMYKNSDLLGGSTMSQDSKYQLIKCIFNSLKAAFPEEWENSSTNKTRTARSLLFHSATLMTLCSAAITIYEKTRPNNETLVLLMKSITMNWSLWKDGEHPLSLPSSFKFMSAAKSDIVNYVLHVKKNITNE